MLRRSPPSWRLVQWKKRQVYRRKVGERVLLAARSTTNWVWSVRASEEEAPLAQGSTLTRRRAQGEAEAAAGLVEPGEALFV